jgi:dipeptidyl aminopeptidase/acylaminoacyl peptidase
MRITLFLSLVLIVLVGVLAYRSMTLQQIPITVPVVQVDRQTAIPTPVPELLHPLAIEAMRAKSYPGSDFIIEETLPSGSNYKRFIASYQSDGLKIYGLLTIPNGEKPEGGYPAIVFNHGYIEPEVYRPTERYIAYVDNLARSGFVVFRPDYRGHSSSEGQPEGAYFSPGYTVDVLNAFSSLKKHTDVNPNRIGMWGHSLGGFITLKSMVIDKQIKAGVIWGGVVGTYEDMFTYWWNRRTNYQGWAPSNREQNVRTMTRQKLIEKYGEATAGGQFWKAISAQNYVADISGPMQIHHGLSDETVPWELSESLHKALNKVGKVNEYYTYPGGNHDIADPHFMPAMNRTVEFFKKHL